MPPAGPVVSFKPTAPEIKNTLTFTRFCPPFPCPPVRAPLQNTNRAHLCIIPRGFQNNRQSNSRAQWSMGVGVPARKKKSNRVNKISARLALRLLGRPVPAVLYYSTHFPPRTFLVGVQQPHETGGGGNEKKYSRQPNGAFSDSKMLCICALCWEDIVLLLTVVRWPCSC